jgi:hypothetical protein
MFAIIAIVCKTLFLTLPPVLLLGRYFWSWRLSWPTVVASTAILGWGLLVTHELVQERENERLERAYCEQSKLEAAKQSRPGNGVAVLDYPCRIVHYSYSYNYELGWLKALIWLLPWLCVYALVQSLRKRRTQFVSPLPNKSLERTRER